jgi:serralysin
LPVRSDLSNFGFQDFGFTENAATTVSGLVKNKAIFHIKTRTMKMRGLLIPVLFLSASELYAQKHLPGSCATKLADLISKEKIDTTKPRGMADNYYLWDPGATVTVKFMPGGSHSLRNEVINYAKFWEQYANIKFKFVPDDATVTNIRVKLTDNDGAWSTIGTQCNNVSQSEHTLNLDTVDFKQRAGAAYWRATVMHEFGHSLGLLHEQSYPGGIKWNMPAVYNYYLKHSDWDSAMIKSQVLEVNDLFYANGTAYDSKSIMQYWVRKEFTLDGVEIPENVELSAGDKTVIAALYPRVGPRANEVPRISVTNPRIKVQQNKLRDGIAIYPTFNLKSNGKLGIVYFIARLVDENDYYVATTSENYNINGYVATYNRATILPNSNVTYNATGAKTNLELFIPYSYIPLPNDAKVRVEFYLILSDEVNKQYKQVGSRYYTQLFNISK